MKKNTVYISIQHFLYFSSSLSNHLPIYSYIFLSNPLSIFLAFYKNIYLFIYLSIHPYICALPLGKKSISMTLIHTLFPTYSDQGMAKWKKKYNFSHEFPARRPTLVQSNYFSMTRAYFTMRNEYNPVFRIHPFRKKRIPDLGSRSYHEFQ